MSDAVGSLLAEISQSTELGTVLYLGMSGTTSAILLPSTARHIALAVPSQLIPASLIQQAAVTPRLSLHPVLVSDIAGQAQLTFFNFPALSSTRVPSATLRSLFPNLTSTRQIDIDTVTLNDLTASIPLEDDLPNILVIDTPGNEEAVIASLHEPDGMGRFAHIILRAGSEAMYQGALSFGQLADQLLDAGYRPQQRKTDDPNFPCVHFCFEPLVFQLNDLIPRLKLVSEDNETNLEVIDALGIQTNELKAGLETSKAALAEKAEAFRQQGEKLTALETSHAQGQEARRKAEKQTNELKAELEKAQKQLNALATLRQQLREQDAALHEERMSSRRLKDELLRVEAQLKLLREFMDLGVSQKKVCLDAETLPKVATLDK